MAFSLEAVPQPSDQGYRCSELVSIAKPVAQSYLYRAFFCERKKNGMIIVAGKIYVKTDCREEFLAGSIASIQTARRTSGCLDFAVSPDPIEENRVNIFEKWASRAALEAFRGDGPSGDVVKLIATVQVHEIETSDNPA